MRARTILIADDEMGLRAMLCEYLIAEGFEVLEASTGPETVEIARRGDPDLVVLDVGMPGLDGFEVLQRLRTRSDVPVIMLTARSDESDRIVGLMAGADDYVTKPFSPRELSARIKAVLRRGRRDDPDEKTFEYPGLSIDTLRREIRLGDQIVELTTLEFELLVALASSPGRVFTRDQLLQNVWGWGHFGVDRVVDVHIGSIRKALGDDPTDPKYVGTVRGIGYRFVAEPL